MWYKKEISTVASHSQNMSLSHTVLLSIVFLHSSSCVTALECYQCTNVTSLDSCGTTTKCPDNSICHKEYETVQGNTYFTLGCKSDSSCPATTGSGSLIGRSADACSECCREGLCNRQLCQHGYPNCADNSDVNCNLIGTMAAVCTDTQHMKNVCKRFCGLCSLVDGGWSSWGAWSICDVTCENGTKIRTRQCDNPAPAYGGNNCVGGSVQSISCMVDLKCPVDGGWTSWSSWGACSATCDIGLNKRHRSCVNPNPSFNGRSCQGDSHEEKLCYPGACADGNWSPWGYWSTCPVTCGGGLTSRTRSCDRPTPSITGKYCTGNPTQTAICNHNPCEHTVAFKARLVTGTSGHFANRERLVYTDVLLNEGGGYDNSTGIFTSPSSGTFLFTAQICSMQEKFVEVYIMANYARVGEVSHEDAQGGSLGDCASGSGIAILSKGQRAWVQTIGSYDNALYQDNESWIFFSGVLVGH